eukprot:m.14091 g.14091  ORF g.14091 m.14091 type:complete len:576 (+) comp4985_c0_seq1:367-2094(+)
MYIKDLGQMADPPIKGEGSVDRDEQDAYIYSLLTALQTESEREGSLSALASLYQSKFADMKESLRDQKEGQESAPCEDPDWATMKKHLPTIVRLSIGCPHSEVRTICGEIAKEAAALGLRNPRPKSSRISLYISPGEVPPMDSTDEDVHAEYIEAFAADGRVSHFTQILAMHPEYLTPLRESHNFMLWGPGSLPLPERHMIAIMASSSHNCKYLMDIHTRHFLDLGGDAKWLESSEHLPRKYQLLLGLNATLAYQPWLLQVEHIAPLVKSGADNFSLNELCHALVIMTHFHGLTGIIWGCGVLPEPDAVEETLLNSLDCEGSPSPTEVFDITDADEGAQETKMTSEATAEKLRQTAFSPREDDDDHVHLEDFAAADNDGSPADGADADVEDDKESNQYTIFTWDAQDSPFPRITKHVDFDVKSKELSLFRMQHFSWVDEGYSTLNRYCPDIGDLLENEFRVSKNLTYEFMGEVRNVNTFPFRWAIWNYVYRTKGVVDDDYTYKEVNKMLTKEVKGFVKTLCCFPHLITHKQWTSFMDIKPSEKVHICILAAEARKQSELLYGLRTVMHLMEPQSR